MKIKKNFKVSILILGVVIIPLLYSFFYLRAFWNPYNTLDTLPVAVVNEDTGAAINDTDRNLGDEVVKELKDSGKLKFITTNETDAARGVREGKYYASITIPDDFSGNVATADSADKKKATIYYDVNQKHNYIASQILGKAVEQIEENVRGSVSKEITNQLVLQLQGVPDQLQTLSGGLSTLDDGAKSLQDGTQQVQSGTQSLKDGASSLKGGLLSLSSGAQSLNSGAAQAASGASSLKTGTASLNAGLQTLNTGAQSLNSGAAQTATGAKSLSDGAALLKSRFFGAFAPGVKQLLAQFNITGSTDPNTQTLADKVGALNTGAKQVSAGLGQLSSGTNSANTYVTSVNNSIFQMIVTDQAASATLLSTYATKYQQFTTLYNAATDTTLKAQYASGMQLYGNLVLLYQAALAHPTSEQDFETALKTSTNLVSAGQQVTGAISQLATGAASVAVGTETLNGQLKTSGDASNPSLYDALNALAAQTQTTGSTDPNTQMLADGISGVADGAAQLSDGAAQVAAGAAQVAGGTNDAANGAAQVATGAAQLSDGTAQVAGGAAQVASGAGDAADGASQLSSGASQLADGADALNSGASQLTSGVDTAKSTVDSKTDQARNDLKKTAGLGDYTKDSVSVAEKDVNAIANYGTAFAPYFMSLSLWVGALLVFFGIYLDADERIKLLSRHSPNKLLRVAAFVLIGVAQAVALALIVQFALGLKVNNVPAFYFSCILTSIVFVSIVEFFIVNLKDVGKFLAMLTLILQLTSNGGTFPMETVPKFFNALYPFMPMTYSVRLFKECITNFSMHGAASDIAVLVGIFALFTVLNILFSLTRRVKAKLNGGGARPAAKPL